MAEGGFDDSEMKDINEEKEEDERRNEETSFNDNDDYNSHNKSINIINTSNPKSKFSRVDYREHIPDVNKDAGSIRKSLTNDRKKSFKKIFNVDLEKKNGPSNSILLDNTVFVKDQPGNQTENISIVFKGKKIGNVKNLEPELFSRKNKKYVDEFNDNMKKAIKEYEKTPAALVEQQLNESYEPKVVDDIIKNSIGKVADIVDNIVDDSVTVKKQDVREFTGVLDPKGKTPLEKIEFLQIQADHWRLEALRETDVNKERLYNSLERVAKLQADNIRLENNERPIHVETKSIIDEEAKESDLGRLERFKKWAKENLVGISAVAIAIAGIITTIVVRAGKVVKQGAKAMSSLAKAIANVAKKLGPLIASILNLVAQMLTWGAKGIEFLAKNLWLLAIALAYLVYDQYKERKKK